MRRNAAPQAPPAGGMEGMKKCSAGGAVGTFYVPWIPLHKQATQRGTGRISGMRTSGVACSLPPRWVPRRRQGPCDQDPRSRCGHRPQRPRYPCQLGHGTFAGAAAVHGGVVAGSFGRKPQKTYGKKSQPTKTRTFCATPSRNVFPSQN
eukprot:gene15066-biopygen3642